MEHYQSGGGGLPVTFQVILNEDGTILVQYLSMQDVEGATVGIENELGTDGLQVVNNAAYVHDDLAVEFTSVHWLSRRR